VNPTEIKNADKWELYEYVKDLGYDVFPTSTKKKLRDCALDLYWRMRENPGHSSLEEERTGTY
jgi:hypothetical protein